MLPIAEKMDKVGYAAVECWGGATFDASFVSCMRIVGETEKAESGLQEHEAADAFQRPEHSGIPPFADDVVEYFVQKSIANGIDIIRIFDCLNDLRNLECAVKACNKEGGHAQVALSYTLGDAYTLDYWMNIAKEIESMGANSHLHQGYGRPAGSL